MSKKYTFQELVDILAMLRGENGCPWDKEQTHETLKKYLIEETYEVLDAIDSNESSKHCDELGDLLLQIVFQAQIAKEEGTFDIEDVTSAICSKLIHRHPHVFGEDKLSKASQVEQKWAEIKKEEKGETTYTQGLFDIPKGLPSLMRSYKIQKKAAQVGFDWDKVEDAFLKIYEETEELKEVYKSDDIDRITEEIGDLLFAVVNVSRMLKIEPETALTLTIKKFIKRFGYIEENSFKLGKKLEEMSLEEMDKLWNEAKKL